MSWEATDEVDWDAMEDVSTAVSVTVRDVDTKDVLATVNGISLDKKMSFLMECICREAGLPCRPQITWNGRATLPWETFEELEITDGAELQCETQLALVTASHDGFAKIWNMNAGECETTLAGHEGKVLAASFNFTGRNIVTASEDHTAKIWSTLTGKCERTLNHSGEVYSAAYSHDGKLICTASEDKTAKVWVVKTGACRLTLRGHTEAVYHAAFTPGNAQVLTESRDGTTRLWNPLTGVCDRTLMEQAGVYSASFSNNGRFVATTPGDFTATIIDVNTGECEMTLMGHEDLVISANYCPTRPKPEPPKSKKESLLGGMFGSKGGGDSSAEGGEN